ncbi:MAG TPA: NYN domain-containing protein [Candidatus Aphodovivens avistercoris]|nr:NYN domain-containing protein [Candidatus Aphodovivens avistercoris]
MEKQASEKRFALLIDADNVSAKYIKPITDELSNYGTVTIKRIYGDWTLTLHAKWKDALLENSLTPIQQFGYTQGKNATDSAMIIDAMDILYTGSVDGFCIVSSDSDFTRLASRLRESGRMVIGMGEKKTPTPFRRACDVFTTLELLLDDANGRRKGKGEGGQQSGPTIGEVEQAVVRIVTDNQNNGKSTGLGEVGSRLLKRFPDFDVRSYGTNLLSKLLGKFASVEVTKRGSDVTVELADDREGAKEPKEAKEGRAAKEGASAPQGKAKAEAAPDASADGGCEPDGADTPSAEAGETGAGADVSAGEGSAEAGKADGEPSSRRRRRRGGGRRKQAQEPQEDQEREQADEAAPHDGGASEDGPEKEKGAPAAGEAENRPGRAGRSTRRKSAANGGSEPRHDVSPTGEDEGAEPAPRDGASRQPSANEAEDDAAEHPDARRAPRSRRRGKKPAAADGAAEETASAAPEHAAGAEASAAPPSDNPAPAEPASEADAAPTAPKRPRRRAARASASTQTAADGGQAGPAASADELAAVDATTRRLVADAGADGIEVSRLARLVRASHRGFKVRDHGHAQFKSYVASLGDIEVERIGKDWFARMAD